MRHCFNSEKTQKRLTNFTFRLQIERDDVVEMRAFEPQLLIARPFVETDGGIDGRQQFSVEFDEGIRSTANLLLGNL